MVLVAALTLTTLAWSSSAYIFPRRHDITFFVESNSRRPIGASPSVSSSCLQSMISATGVESRNRGTTGRKKDDADPNYEIQTYLDEPKPITPRADLTGSVLVSGWVRPGIKRSDQTVFDFLHSEESAFGFTKIVALVDDVKFARKRLLGRSARYTGLLDVLDFLETVEKQAVPLPTAEQLGGIKHWVVNVDLAEENAEDAVTTLKKIAILCASAPDLANLSILISGAIDLDLTACHDVFTSYADKSYKYSVVAVGKLEEYPEGEVAYDVFGGNSTFCASLENKTVIGSDDVLSRDESVRLVTECLQLESAADKVFGFAEVRSTNITVDAGARLVKGLREAGYTRPQEIDYMILDGLKDYVDECERWGEKWEYLEDEEFTEFEEPEWQKEAMKEWEERGNVKLKSAKDEEDGDEES